MIEANERPVRFRVAIFAHIAGRDVIWRLADGRDGRRSAVTAAALRWRSLEHAADVAAFARRKEVLSGERKARHEMVDVGTAIRCGNGAAVDRPKQQGQGRERC